jgi:predicted metal-dependent peptidase
LWNIACDHAVNNILLDAGLTPIDGRLCDARFKNQSAERIYETIRAEAHEQEKEDAAKNGDDKNGEPQEQGNPPTNNKLGDNQGDNPQETGEKGTPSETPGEPSGESGTSAQEKPWSHPKTGRFVDAVNENGEQASPAEMEQMATEWVVNEGTAARHAERCGKLPGNIKSLLEDMRPTMPWKAVLRRFCTASAMTRSNWMRPNRSLISRGVHLPSKTGKKLKSLVIALDTSGSLLDQQAALLAEVNSALHQYPIDKVYVLHVDSKVRHIDVFTKGTPLKISATYGGGGTDLRAPFEWAGELAEQIYGIIYITDLMGPTPENSSFRTLWICTERPSFVSGFLPKFGEVVYMRD